MPCRLARRREISGRADRFVGALGEFVDVDADREGGELGPAPLRNDRAVDRRDAKLVVQVVFEILPVLDGLESDQIVGEHVANDLVEMRHRRHGAPFGPRRVQEEADRAIDVELAQFDAQGEEMIVLHPEHRFRRVEAQQRARHEGVDLAIGRVVLVRDLDQVRTRMQRRPQARIGKALVIAEIMLRRHVDGRQRAGAERLDPGERILGLRGIAGHGRWSRPRWRRTP